MTVIVTDKGFSVDTWPHGFVAPGDWQTGMAEGIEIGLDSDPAALPLAVPMIRVAVPSVADGRGFTLARRLRLLGYAGRVRAAGAVLADQYAMARRSGFDEVEIDEARAARQPEAQWLARADWRAHDYRAHLGVSVG